MTQTQVTVSLDIPQFSVSAPQLALIKELAAKMAQKDKEQTALIEQLTLEKNTLMEANTQLAARVSELAARVSELESASDTQQADYCRFGAQCTKTAKTSTKVCRYGASCRNIHTSCKFQHPT